MTKKITLKTHLVTMGEPKKTIPTVPPEHVYLVLSTEELVSMTQIFSFARDLFEQMATNAAKEAGNEKVQVIYGARAQLSEMLYNKLITLVNIGEPISRDVH